MWNLAACKESFLTYSWLCDLCIFLDFSGPSFLTECCRLPALPLLYVARRTKESVIAGTCDLCCPHTPPEHFCGTSLGKRISGARSGSHSTFPGEFLDPRDSLKNSGQALDPSGRSEPSPHKAGLCLGVCGCALGCPPMRLHVPLQHVGT